MDGILVSTVSATGASIDAKIEIALSGGEYTVVDGGFASLPDAPRPLTFKLRVTGDAKTLFPVELEATYSGGGQLEVTGELASFSPPRAAVVDGSAAMSLIVFLYRLRDAATDVAPVLATPPPDRPGEFSPPLDRVTTTAARNYLQDPPTDASNVLSFKQKVVDAAADHVIFELKVPSAPKAISVAWPDAVERTDNAAAPDVLVYFHPDVGQNFGAGYYRGSYPFSFDFLYYGIVTYNWYRGDPLVDDPYRKGIQFQLAAAGRKVVSVLGVNRVGQEIGVFLNADSLHDVLLEIVAFMLRRKRVFRDPSLGRVGLASFSAGNRWVTAFLESNKSKVFCTNILKEVYGFEPPGDAVSPWLAAVDHWMSSGSSADKQARVYTLASPAASYAQFLGRAITERAPHFATSADGRRTTAVVPIANWATIRPNLTTDFQECHQLVSALLLTHAARASKFAQTP